MWGQRSSCLKHGKVQSRNYLLKHKSDQTCLSMPYKQELVTVLSVVIGSREGIILKQKVAEKLWKFQWMLQMQ